MKSQPTWPSIANSVGRAYRTGKAPAPIWVPISTPTTWAMAAPGPRIGESTGIATMKLSSSNPSGLLASGVTLWAKTCEIPV